jgi:short-subunit dehydrogenase
MHVVITGASSGIGEALVREYASRGAEITMVARRRPLMERLAAELSVKTHLAEVDLGNVQHACDWMQDAINALGPIDVLVNNAGVSLVGPVQSTPFESGEALLLLNVHTPLKLIQAVVPSMLERGGAIVNIASVAALAPTPGSFFYNASKGALAAASESLRGELRGTKVRVVTVYPGPVHSALEVAMRANYEDTAAARLSPTGDSDVLAKLVADAEKANRARVIYPRIYGLARHFPNATRFFLDRFTPKVRQLPAKGASEGEDRASRNGKMG